MVRQSIAERVAAIILPVIEEMGLELVDVEYLKEGTDFYLRAYIDHDDGINLNDCEKVSRKIESVLDYHDKNNKLFPKSYILEVSSPGLTRPLKKEKDFQRYRGKLVTIKTYAPIDGKKEFSGILLGNTSEGIELEVEGNRLIVPKEKISLVHLALEFK